MRSKTLDCFVKYSLLLIFLLLASNTNFRSFDQAIYFKYFNSIPSFSNIIHCLNNDYPPVAPLFKVIVSIIKSFDGGFKIVALFYGVITCVVFFYSFLKVSNNFYFTLFLYSVLYFYFLAMGQIRQGAALSFVFLSMYFFLNKRLSLFLISVFVATLFHYSAIIFLPIYFFNRLHFSRNLLILFILCSIVISFLTQGLNLSFFSLLLDKGTFLNKISVYSHKMIGEYNLLAQVESILICFLLLVFYNNTQLNNTFLFYKKMAIIFIIGTCGCLLLLNMMTVLALRGFLYYKSVLVFLIPMFSIFFKNKQKLAFYAVIITYFFFRFIYKLYMLNFLKFDYFT